MPHRNARIKLPASFRNAPTAPGFARTTLALGVSSALLAPLQATVAADVIDLDKLQIEERTIDTNPNAEAGAPYKAKTSGDERITRLLDTARASRFHASGELSSQNRPISVCSADRAFGVLTSPPSAFTSL